MTILSFFTLNIPIRRLWTNLYHKEDHFLKIWPLLHYFSEIYLKICDFTLFLKNFFCPFKKTHVLMMFCVIWRYFTFQDPGFMLEFYKCRFDMDLNNRLLLLLFPNISVVIIIIISAITIKMKIRIFIVLRWLWKIVEHSSKILDDKISQMDLVAGCWRFGGLRMITANFR